MCGIVATTAGEEQLVRKSLEVLHHRGPDAHGLWPGPLPGLWLGHVRLSILDLEARSHQPMQCPRTGNVISFNGEIYNFPQIRRELASLGWCFRTQSDTEVLLAAYGQWGRACLDRLNGMFAFVIYDSARQQLFLARDRAGKKPLYLAGTGRTLHCASEIKAIWKLQPNLPREVDYAALREYMSLGYIPGEMTIYRSIRKLPPGHFAVLDLQSGAMHKERYWQLPAPDECHRDENEAAEELEALLEDAVRIRLQSDVPLGVFLSGGLDSSLVAAMALRANPNMVAYTAQFPLAKYDESQVASRVAQWIGAEHRLLPIEASDGSQLDRLCDQFDEPLADSSMLPTYLISEAIRRHVTVALSGDGGDELFAGYGTYATVAAEQRWEVLPRALRRCAASMGELFPQGVRGKNFLRRLPYDGVEKFMFQWRAPEEMRYQLLSPDVAAQVEQWPEDGYRRELLQQLIQETPPVSPLQAMTRLDFYSYLPDDILVKVDRASMLASLEVRSPLLDYRIIEFAYRLPDRLRMRDGTRKYLLKRIAAKYLPPDFPYEQKRGFCIPESEWFAGAWQQTLREAARDSSFVTAHAVDRLQQEHRQTGRNSRMLFKTMILAKSAKRWRWAA